MHTPEKQPSSLKSTIALAHVRLDNVGQWFEHTLEEHLHGVATLAETFATAFDAGDWAKLAGLWHDLGKYRPAFQRYIRSASGYDAHIEAPNKVDHSTAGALYAIKRMGGLGRILAYLIAGHHAGLPDWQSAEAPVSSLINRLQQPDLLAEALAQPLPADILDAPPPTSNPGQRDLALWIRLLFSCLVDADFLDTEQFMAPEKAALRSRYSALDALEPRFDAHMTALAAQADGTPVNQSRAVVLVRCREAASQSPGLFSLTVPTGGGKTLASLAFALKHARLHDHRRIIYVIPYTSIIEQTADVFRRVFGDDAVLEHHSNLDSDRENPHSRLAAENWDAPLIVTTNVQFFESLFAARSSRTRKLHRILNSVVILDEAQLLPTDFLTPILGAIRELSLHYGVSFVLCTATQPALTSQRGFEGKLFDGLDNVREIMGDAAATDALHQQLRRVEVILPADLSQPTSWETLAAELETHPRALCIVDRRDDCRTLHGLLPPGAIHLSGLMCGQHRAEVIAMIKQRLKAGEPIRVVSTQLVEAGVDVDFPVVYRALAGLDSIAQAAGRCNREGRLPGLGRVVVFVPPTQPPAGHLRQACDAGRQLLLRQPVDPLAPALFNEYFQSLYWRKGAERLDHKGIMALLKNNQRLEFSFRTAAERFQLIPETQMPVIVRYSDNHRLLAQLARPGDLNRGVLRKLQRYVVNIPRRIHQQLLTEGAIQEQQPGVFVQITHLYDPVLGLQVDNVMNYPPDDLIV
ncbi:MAG: CRISPR-associated endonuclease Cas3'' [Candidatus Contendobacter sp.]|nr:CRISPR-associated endonuclease Cas3'' [Candidatus Contendobacter sp.]